MEIEVKEIEPCKLSIHYVANAEEILNKRSEVMTAFKKASVPGFRPGKATMDAIKIHYRTQIDESLKRSLAEDAFHNTLFEKKLKPYGTPHFSSLLLADGKFICDFDLHTKPEFELLPYVNLEIPKPAQEQTIEQTTEKMLQELRVRFGDSAPFVDTDFVQNSDSVIVDYEGFIDGLKVDKLCAIGEMITVGASKLSQFDDNILGMRVGETREFDLIVPAGGLPSLAGKLVHLVVTLTMGSKNTPCALDDSLATKLGKKDFADLRVFVSGTAASSVQNKNKQLLGEAIAAKLIDMNEITVPNWLALSEAQYLVHNAKLDWATLEDLDKEKYLSVGEKNVKLSLILDKIRELSPEAQLSDQEVLDVVKNHIIKNQPDAQVDETIQKMNKSGYLQILLSRIKDEYTMDFITKSVKLLD